MNPLFALIDPLRPTAEKAPDKYRFSPDIRSWAIPLGLGAALIILSVILGMTGAEEGHLFSQRFYFAYLIGWVFCVTVSLGALFFVMVQHISNADWSVVVRRIPEILMMNFPILIIFGIPVLLGMHDLYHWTHEELYIPGGEHYDPVLDGKRGYLNTPFFVIRLAVYFVVWTYLSYRLYRYSLSQDTDPRPAGRIKQERKISAWGMLVFALTTGFAGIDLLMTLDPHWFSTMFGVYFFAGTFFVILATVTMMALMLQRGGYLLNVITEEHYHDLGKFMFGFTVFWAYIAFSQYMLIWYGNLPEETIWFRHRLEGSWGYASAALLIGHFIIPFFVLMFRSVKRNRTLLLLVTFWFLLVHFLDLYWIAMPVFDHHHFEVTVMDVTIWLGLAFFFAGLVVLRAARHAVVPYNDPKLALSLSFENA